MDAKRLGQLVGHLEKKAIIGKMLGALGRFATKSPGRMAGTAAAGVFAPGAVMDIGKKLHDLSPYANPATPSWDPQWTTAREGTGIGSWLRHPLQNAASSMGYGDDTPFRVDQSQGQWGFGPDGQLRQKMPASGLKIRPDIQNKLNSSDPRAQDYARSLLGMKYIPPKNQGTHASNSPSYSHASWGSLTPREGYYD